MTVIEVSLIVTLMVSGGSGSETATLARTLQEGGVHLVLFAAFVFLAVSP